LRLCGSKPARHGPALLVGHSDGGRLRAAPQEAQQIATLLADKHEVRCLLETDATAAAISALLPDCGLLHFAGHAVFRPDNPRFSWLRLDGGRLAIIDLEQLTLRGNPLVVLSACETGRGLPRGGGLLGMGRALMAAGASALIVSLWQIVDASAAAVMVDLYTHLHGAPAAALCQAQRMAIVRGDHPAHWAGFICVAG
jgi:CHAT domain-containing protein